MGRGPQSSHLPAHGALPFLRAQLRVQTHPQKSSTLTFEILPHPTQLLSHQRCPREAHPTGGHVWRGFEKRQLTLGTSSRDDELTTRGKQGYLSHHPTQEPFLASPTSSNLSQPGSLRKVKDSFGVSSPEVCGRLSLQLQLEKFRKPVHS